MGGGEAAGNVTGGEVAGTRREPAGHIPRGEAGYESKRGAGDLGDEPAGAVDVLIVSLGSTGGLRRADEELAGALRRAGASVEVVPAVPPRQMRTLALTDLTWSLAARRAARAELARRAPRAVIYSS